MSLELTTEEKRARLEAIGEHVKLIDSRYGFKECPPHLVEALEEVRAALKDRENRIIEA